MGIGTECRGFFVSYYCLSLLLIRLNSYRSRPPLCLANHVVNSGPTAGRSRHAVTRENFRPEFLDSSQISCTATIR